MLNFGVLFAMPVFAVPAIILGPPIDTALVNGAIVAAVSFVAAALIGGLFLAWDRPLRALGDLIDWIARKLTREGPDAMPRADRLVASRDLIRT